MSEPRGRVLVVEDDPAIAHLVAEYLTHDGFRVDVADDGEDGVELARQTRPDVVVLDLMLPGIDGLEVCRRVRTFSDAYVLMLTARGDETDRVIGLSVGADDYVVKPFSPRELSARVQAMLRRPRSADVEPGTVRRFGDLVLDPQAREVSVRGVPVELTRTEFDVLEALSARPRAVVARRRLLEHVWGEDWYGDDHVIDVHVANLRRKLGDDPAASRYVRTVRGVGYRMGDGT
ncbi:response regulator transcription factor [Cellulomonas soli]|uniref:Putative sensory transduction protein n=1 Tax=Cellulomonas soli TaxID=931535 RepID=A0A512PGJ3_9CELL|nr:response regulator transcription factor [Cellulomonas soli]NYI58185.1 DNA-binding response OmpR family regulator [Cellulomonas soli]GEP70318.1 putative sensory transduction protein [Cellulomonas soli]